MAQLVLTEQLAHKEMWVPLDHKDHKEMWELLVSKVLLAHKAI
jgi:hypothetical protein